MRWVAAGKQIPFGDTNFGVIREFSWRVSAVGPTLAMRFLALRQNLCHRKVIKRDARRGYIIQFVVRELV